MSKERLVDLSGPTTAAQAQQLCGGEHGTRLYDLATSIPEFIKLSYNGFRAEYHIPGESIVVHFYLPQNKRVTEKYWKESFAAVLNVVGQEHFQAAAPRLVARYTEELQSWWFRAQGYGHIIDLHAYVESFFGKLDAHLAPALQAQSKSI